MSSVKLETACKRVGIYRKYFSAETSKNFSINRSESRAAMWAARPTSALAVWGRACCTS